MYFSIFDISTRAGTIEIEIDKIEFSRVVNDFYRMELIWLLISLPNHLKK